VSQHLKTVIPDEPTAGWRDPESRTYKCYQYILDPGSHPAWRDLAGMTDYETASRGRGIAVIEHSSGSSSVFKGFPL